MEISDLICQFLILDSTRSPLVVNDLCMFYSTEVGFGKDKTGNSMRSEKLIYANSIDY